MSDGELEELEEMKDAVGNLEDSPINHIIGRPMEEEGKATTYDAKIVDKPIVKGGLYLKKI